MSVTHHFHYAIWPIQVSADPLWHFIHDVVIYASDSTQHVKHVREFLQRCAERKIILNPDKWEYAQSKVTFAGFNLSKDGYSIDSPIAIARFPTPSNHTDLRAFFWIA